MDLDMKLKFNFNKRNRYKNICSIEGCNNSACGKYCNKHYHQIKRYGNIKTRTHFHVENYSDTNFTDDLNDGEEFLYTTIRCKDDKEVTLLCNIVVLKVIKDEEMRNNK